MRGEWYMGAVELQGRRRVLSADGGSNIMFGTTQPVPLLTQIKQLKQIENVQANLRRESQ
jgi:hypothetical protein